MIWDYDRLKHILPFKQSKTNSPVPERRLGLRLRFIFFGASIAALAVIIIGTSYLYEITPGNSEAECRNQCDKNPGACEFCDCIYKEGKPLDSCLAAFDRTKDIRKSNAK